MDDLQHDPRAEAVAYVLGSFEAESGNPDGTGGSFGALAATWLPSRSRDNADEPDRGGAFLVLLGTRHRGGSGIDAGQIVAPYLVAVQRRGDGIAPWNRTPWSDLTAVAEHPTIDGALAAYAARLTGIAVEALAEGHGL